MTSYDMQHAKTRKNDDIRSSGGGGHLFSTHGKRGEGRVKAYAMSTRREGVETPKHVRKKPPFACVL